MKKGWNRKWHKIEGIGQDCREHFDSKGMNDFRVMVNESLNENFEYDGWVSESLMFTKQSDFGTFGPRITGMRSRSAVFKATVKAMILNGWKVTDV